MHNVNLSLNLSRISK